VSASDRIVVSAWIDTSEARALQKLAAEGDRSVSAEVRRAVRAYLSPREERAIHVYIDGETLATTTVERKP
jgi:plasmid stability protein